MSGRRLGMLCFPKHACLLLSAASQSRLQNDPRDLVKNKQHSECNKTLRFELPLRDVMCFSFEPAFAASL